MAGGKFEQLQYVWDNLLSYINQTILSNVMLIWQNARYYAVGCYRSWFIEGKLNNNWNIREVVQREVMPFFQHTLMVYYCKKISNYILPGIFKISSMHSGCSHTLCFLPDLSPIECARNMTCWLVYKAVWQWDDPKYLYSVSWYIATLVKIVGGITKYWHMYVCYSEMLILQIFSIL